MEEKREKKRRNANAAARLRADGLSTIEIAKRLGVSRSYVRALITDPDGSKESARKKKYGGTCADCGGRTSVRREGGGAHRRCQKCVNKSPDRLYWTKEKIIEAIQLFAKEKGRPPTSKEWLIYKGDKRDKRFPNTPTVQIRFGSWSNGIEAAGFPRPIIGQYQVSSRQEAVLKRKPRKPRKTQPLKRRATPWSEEEAAAAVRAASPWGVAPSIQNPRVRTIYQQARRRGVSWESICEKAGVRPRGKRLL